MIFLSTRIKFKKVLELDEQLCEHCGGTKIEFYKKVIKMYILIIPCGSMNGGYTAKCSNCGYEYELIKEQEKQLKEIMK